MDLSQFLDFLGEARYQLNSTIEYLQVDDQSHVIPQFVMFFDWFIVQATDQFLATLEITRNYGDTPPELRLQILYLLNELVVDRISPEEVFYQLDQLNDREFPQIEEIFEEEELDEEVKVSGTDSDGRDEENKLEVVEKQTIDQSEIKQNCDEIKEEGAQDNELDESKESEHFKYDESKSEVSKSEVSKVEESNSFEQKHLRTLFLKGVVYPEIAVDEAFKTHFGQFGNIVEYIEARNPNNKRGRGFCLITYRSASMAEAALRASPHLIAGRVVHSKLDDPAIAQARKMRIYVARLWADIVEDDLREYFTHYGTVVRVKIVVRAGARKSYAYVQFDQYEPVDRIFKEKHHRIKGYVLEARRSLIFQRVHSVQHEDGGGARDVAVMQAGSSGFSRGGNGGNSRGGGFNGRNSRKGWNQQRGQQHQRSGRNSDNGNSRYGRSAGGGPIRRPNNRSSVGRYKNRTGNNR